MDKSPAIDEWTASFALTEWMASLLFGVSAGRPLIFIGVTPLSLALAVCFVPRGGAANVDVVGVGLPLVTTRVRVLQNPQGRACRSRVLRDRVAR